MRVFRSFLPINICPNHRLIINIIMYWPNFLNRQTSPRAQALIICLCLHLHANAYKSSHILRFGGQAWSPPSVTITTLDVATSSVTLSISLCLISSPLFFCWTVLNDYHKLSITDVRVLYTYTLFRWTAKGVQAFLIRSEDTCREEARWGRKWWWAKHPWRCPRIVRRSHTPTSSISTAWSKSWSPKCTSPTPPASRGSFRSSLAMPLRTH